MPPLVGANTRPDQGWCSGAILYDIEQGQIDGIDVGEQGRVCRGLAPATSLGARGRPASILTTRPVPTSAELEAVFRGQKGGLLEGLMGAR